MGDVLKISSVLQLPRPDMESFSRRSAFAPARTHGGFQLRQLEISSL